MEKSIAISKPFTITSKITDYAQLAKMKLSLLVVFSASMAFIMSSEGAVNWSKFILLTIGGFLVTGAANAFNQVIEKDLDALMDRTKTRPLPDNRMKPIEALIVATIFAITGLYLLFAFMNTASGVLGLIALLSYTVVYTPLKRVTPFAVFIGAFPGAIPPLLGVVAATGHFGIVAGTQFAIQFIWQFPHFWAIAWVLDDDYKKAGFDLLPSRGGRDKASAFQTFVYAFSLIPLGVMPFIFNITGWVALVVMTIAGFIFTWQAWRLYKDCSMNAARRLMFGSFIYLPVVQIILLIDKL
jgi:protoheme IX farnesyltransferase